MAGIARSGTAAWVPTGPTMRPFRFGDQHHPDPDPALKPGTMVGDRYRVVRPLGEGGMGRVYEVEHTFLGRRCALKLLRRDALEQPENVRRFQQEAMAASKIGHVAIVEVIDFATLPDGQVFMVMEMLSGESFEAWMERPGNLGEIIPRLVEVADGLDAAHAAGVLHRDIKPANLFLARASDGSVHAKILDFGIAKMTDRGPNDLQTEAGSVLGTPYYLAPERAMGAAVDARADLYSLGVILYELLTGNVPFEADSFMEILGKHIKSEALDPRQAAPERPIPDRIARLAMKLLAKDPQLRPASAGAVALELNQIARTDADALRAVVTGPRSGQSGRGDSTRVLDEVGDRPTTSPVAGAPMTAFAGSSSSGESTRVLETSGERPNPIPHGAATPAVIEMEPGEDADEVAAGARSAPTTAILLLVGFAVAGAAGGLAYLELAGGDPAAAAEPAGESPDPVTSAGPGEPTPPAEAGAAPPIVAAPPSDQAPDQAPDQDPPAGSTDGGGAGDRDDGAQSDEAKSTVADRGSSPRSGDKKPSTSGAHTKGATKPSKTNDGTAREGQDEAPASDAKTPEPGPTIKDDIYD